MNILLLGGTGVIGGHLALKLCEQGANVFVTSRHHNLANGKIKFIKGNAKDLNFLYSIMDTYWDAIVDFMNYTENEFLARIDIFLKCTDNYCFLSSSRVYSNSDIKPITENSERLLDSHNDKSYLRSNEYGIIKAKEENIILSSGKTNWTIFRPYITYGEKRFQLGALEKEDWLQRVLDGKKIILQKSLCNRYTTLTCAIDVAETMATIILQSNTKTQIYNIVGSSNCCMTWGEVAKIYQCILQKQLGRKIDIIYLTDEQAKILRPGICYFQTSYDRLFNRVFNNVKIKRFKLDNSFKSIQEGLEYSLSLFLKSPTFLFKNIVQEALIDRFTGELSNPYKIKGLKYKLVYLYYRFLKKY